MDCGQDLHVVIVKHFKSGHLSIVFRSIYVLKRDNLASRISPKGEMKYENFYLPVCPETSTLYFRIIVI